jgi:dTDP-glucose 4,6-dehydratase
MKIYIIGINSFIGSSFSKYILEKKYVKKIYGCSRNNLNDNIKKKLKKKIIFNKVDLNKDIKKLIKILNKEKPDIVINFAAQSIVEASWQSPKDWFKTNLLSNIDLLEHLRKSKYLKKYIYSSTPEVYGSTKNKLRENFNYFPNTPYATSKASIDMLMKNYFDQYDFPIIWTRIANIYGPGQQIFKIIPKTIMSIKKNSKIPLHGGGKSKRSFIFSNDVSRALYLIAKNGIPGSIFHISGDQKISIKKLIQIICKKMNANFDKLVKIQPDRPGKDFMYDMISNKIKKKLKWKTSINLEEGISKTINWVEKDYKILKNYKMEYEHKK